MKMHLLNRLVLLPFALVMVFLAVVVFQFNRFAAEFSELAEEREGLAERAAIALLDEGERQFRRAVDWRIPGGNDAEFLEKLTQTNALAGAVTLDAMGGEVSRFIAREATEATAEAVLGSIRRSGRPGGRGSRAPIFERFEHGILVFYTDRTAGSVLVGWEFLDDAVLAERGEMLGGQIRAVLVAGSERSTQAQEADAVLPLIGAEGQRVGSLEVSAVFDALEAGSRFVGRQLIVLWILLIGFLVVFTGVIFGWFGLPLKRLNRALTEHRPEELHGLAKRDHEFGRLADLILRFFAQKEALGREIEARQRVEASLQASESGLREALTKRERLARDIHDSTIQSVFSLGLRIRRMERFAKEGAESDLAGELTELTEQINRIIADMRNLIAELAPSDMQEQNLADAVERLAESFRRSTGAAIDLSIPEELCDEIDRETQLNLFHVIHEAISNALRHGKATRISCVLSCDEAESLTLEICDDGSGFDPAKTFSDGRGLGNMRQRAREIGADFELHSTPGGPTQIHLSGF